MNDMDSGRLLAHIDEAKNWLDKAKEEYKGSNRLRGDLHLNLAQAEVKYAWELSRRSDVSKIDAVHRVDHPSWRQRYILPAAAVLMAGVMIGSVVYWQLQRPFGTKNGTIAVKTETKEKVDSFTAVPAAPETKPQPVVSSQSVPEIMIPEPVPEKSEKPAIKAAKAEKPVAYKADEAREPSVEMPRNPAEDLVPVTVHAAGGGRAESSSVTGKIQHVSGFVIDEEALTREATRSLRLGK